ncbi:hypothetical protein QEZ54_14380 [Catellatospora sp. KI3]|uniref:hypothetical protein n=1 Tax=Catellatospora sp. KI3 TaxID=3041620 RepID=UPI0024827B11|nr:hypothetical protein [Catellatospora sp. KI3]MDI1462157.1 hypothetical protein [Catellatospora sp. KI3]
MDRTIATLRLSVRDRAVLRTGTPPPTRSVSAGDRGPLSEYRLRVDVVTSTGDLPAGTPPPTIAVDGAGDDFGSRG